MAEETNRAVNWAMRDVVCWTLLRSTDRAVYWTVSDTVYGAVGGAVDWAVGGAVCDPRHPALQEFLREVEIQ